MARPTTRATPPIRRATSSLEPFTAGRLEPGADHDAVAFIDLDLSGQDASDSSFLECRLERCAVDGLMLRRARIAETAIVDIHGVSLDLADSTWRDVELSGGRLGALLLAGATMSSVRVRRAKLGFVSVTGGTIDDILFEACEIGSLDARIAQLRSVRFIDCTVGELDVTGATLAKVDLSGARLRSLIGVESLRGAILGHGQLLDLAPLLAAELGIEVRPDPSDGGAETPSEV